MEIRRLCLVSLAPAACVDPAVHEVEVPLRVAGRAATDGVVTKHGVRIELSRADLAFGPLYLCAGTRAGRTCETARLEWRNSVRVDVRQPQPVEVGRLVGFTGRVRSWMYDLGVVSRLTDEAPLVLDAARALDGDSLVLEGTAEWTDRAVPFVFRLRLADDPEVERGVSLVQKSFDDRFDAEIDESGDQTLLVRFDWAPWVADLDASVFMGAPEGERFDLSHDPTVTREVRNALVAGERPVFSWIETPKED